MTAPGTAHQLGTVEEIPLGEGRAYAVAGEQIAVFRPRGGGLYAVSAACPHAGGPLADGQIDDTTVVCPLHLHQYELATGRPRTGQPPLRTFPIEVDGRGCVIIHLPAAADPAPAG